MLSYGLEIIILRRISKHVNIKFVFVLISRICFMNRLSPQLFLVSGALIFDMSEPWIWSILGHVSMFVPHLNVLT